MKAVGELILEVHKLSVPEEKKDFDKKLQSFLKYSGITAAYQHMLAQAKLNNHSHVWDIPTFLGLEVEIENTKALSLPDFWSVKPDNSLRNDGQEFFSIPLTPKQSMEAIVFLFTVLKKFSAGKKPNFSWRTSTQFHLNVINLTEEEFKKLMLLCLFFDPFLFLLAGQDRRDSVFCTPLLEFPDDALSRYLLAKISLHELASNWPKYTSVNLSRMYQQPVPGNPDHPIPGLGTIEFRHFGGSSNLQDLLIWESLILQLYQTAVAYESFSHLLSDIHNCVSTVAIEEFVTPILSPDLQERLQKCNLLELFRPSVCQIKSLLTLPAKTSQIKPGSALGAYLALKAKKTKPAPKKMGKSKFFAEFVDISFTVHPPEES